MVKKSTLVWIILAVFIVTTFIGLFHSKVTRYGSIYSFRGFGGETHLLKFEAGFEEPNPEREIIFPSWVSDDMIENWSFLVIVDSRSWDLGILALPESLAEVQGRGTFVAEVTAEHVAVVQLTYFVPGDHHVIWVDEITYWKPSWWE